MTTQVGPDTETLKLPDPIAGQSSGRSRLWRLWAVLFITLALASSWLIFPYFVEGKNLLQNAGSEITEERSAQHRTLAGVLARTVNNIDGLDVDVLWATDVYFERSSSRRIAAQYDVPDNHVFMVTESVHIGELPIGVPTAVLEVDGKLYEASKVEGPDLAEHHRQTTIWFPRIAPDGTRTIPDDAKSMTLSLTNNWNDANDARVMQWDLPIQYPDAEDSATPPMLILALSIGILSATLTPCLLQLIVVYMATLTGLSAEQMRQGNVVPAEARRRMLLIALAFVVGVTVFYTGAGAVIGFAGKAAQITFEAYSREVALGSGILVIAMGLWMGIQTRAPLVCKIPMPGMMARADKGGYVRSGLMAVGFSLGCMVCFSGSIMALLFIYVGAVGSAWVGAQILFVFSMGVAVPFLAAAFFLSRTLSAMQWVSRYTPQIGLVSTIVIVGFGFVLVFDQFHTLSDLIYPWLGLD
jgi:cytochrome c-type biogenesis protein